MKQGIFELKRVKNLTRDIYQLKFSGDVSGIKNPGEFVNILLPDKFLRRPISICDWDANENNLILLIKTAGAGTRELVRYKPGTRLDILTGLGNGFIIPDGLDLSRVILAGGGIGIAPLYNLAKSLINRDCKPIIAMGYKSAADIFYTREFQKLGCEIKIATEDGSAGVKGFVTDILKLYPERDYIYACGPSAMLKAVYNLNNNLNNFTGGQFSFEARMACGFGACMGCSIATKNGYKRVCKDGPVFFREEIAWD